jgi:hypothetical protein
MKIRSPKAGARRSGSLLPIAAFQSVAVVLFLGLAGGTVIAAEREERCKIEWTSLPSADSVAKLRAASDTPDSGDDVDGAPGARLRPRPLLVAIRSARPTDDQARFQRQVIEFELVQLTAKFFDCATVSERQVHDHPLFEGMRVKAPAIVVFDRSLTNRAMAPGRASARKVYGTMRSMAELDYLTKVDTTLQKARLLLGRFDQVDAARSALQIKEDRRMQAENEGKLGRAAALGREIDAKRAEIDRLYEETDALWEQLWDLELREPLASEAAGNADRP